MATLTERREATACSAVELAGAIRAGELRAREVLEAHIAVIERLNPRLNAVVAERFEMAREEADSADARVASAGPGEELPPLLGVPVTIKESFALEGMPNTAGSMARRGRPASATAVAPARLIAAGAIPVGVTNLSELTLWIEAYNRVYGRTRNPYDPRRTAGGSSGGEGAAVAAGMAPIGLGTDFGGSIRLPAFFNGVFGHKPSAGLVPVGGHFPAPDGPGLAMVGVGPLARRAEDLAPFLRVVAGPDEAQPGLREAPIGDPAAVSLEGLEVVVSEGTSLIPVSRELRAARQRAAAALADAGASVRRVELRGMRRALEPYLAAARQSGKLEEILALDGEPPGSLRGLLADALRRRSPHTPALLLAVVAERATEHLPERLELRAEAAARSLARELAETIGDGVLLHPPFPRPAPRHGRTVGRPWLVANMAVFNLLGLPATQVPLGLGSRGLPLGVQVVAGRDRDHVSIAAAIELERAMGGWVRPPLGG